MMVNGVQRGSPPIHFWAHDSLHAGRNHSKKIAEKIADDGVKPSFWQVIFLQSRVNGCCYDVEDLRHFNWQWPKNTWFRERLVQQLKDPRENQPLA